MGQSVSKEMSCSRQASGQPYGQSLVSSSRTSTSSYASWDSYPALIPSQSNADEMRIKDGENFACKFFRVFGYIKKKVTRKETNMNDKTEATVATDPTDCDIVSSRVYPPVKSLDELVSCTKFTRMELQQMYRGFKNDCPAGVVDRETFKEKYAKLFPEGDSSLYANVIFNTFDTDKDGKITFEDFAVGLSESTHSSLHEKLKWTFRLYDVGGDGILTKEELIEVLDALYRTTTSEYPTACQMSPKFCGDLLMREHIEELFQALDKNENGIVTEDGFIEACLNDRTLLRSLAVANHFSSLTDEEEGIVDQESSFSCSCSSANQGTDAISVDLSPTLLCRNLNRDQSCSNYKEQPPTSLKKEDLELFEIRQRRGRCSTN